MKKRSIYIQKIGPLIIILSSFVSFFAAANGFRLYLKGGTLYGPGNLGIHKLQDGSLDNFIVTAPLTGQVEHANNGSDLPNIYAESLHVGEIDGELSNGLKINENVNAGFVLEIDEPETGEKVKLFVSSISQEFVAPDKDGNLIFKLTAGFDPGLPEFVVTMPVTFVTGAATVPISEKTRRGQKGGSDKAGPYLSGYSHVGRLGDFDQDGLLDGEFVLGGVSPYELIIAEGDPILVIRPFTSDIPVTSKQSSYYAISGITTNFPKLFEQAVNSGEKDNLKRYIGEILDRYSAIEASLKKIKHRRRSLSTSDDQNHNPRTTIKKLLRSKKGFMSTLKHIEKGDINSAKISFNDSIEMLKNIAEPIRT